MIPIKLNNNKISNLLFEIANDVFDKENLKNILDTSEQKERKCNYINEHESYEDKYFYSAIDKKDPTSFGYPRSSLLIKLKENLYASNLIGKKTNKLQRILGAREIALCALYPENGYIGWHHNGNAPGYNILFTYSLDGNGFFKYFDYTSISIKEIKDNPGWNIKVGYYPSEEDEPDRLFWHEAETKNPRLSIAFIIDDRELWMNMIKTISENDFDESIIFDQGPKIIK